MQTDTLVFELRRAITDEIVAALGFKSQGLARDCLGPFLWPPAQLFSTLIARIDHLVGESGVPAAASQLLSRFVDEICVFGGEHIPREGPLLVASNHPGAYDSVALLASLPRQDIKIIVSDVPFLRGLPETSHHMIYTPSEVERRMTALREILRHLKNGGAVLIFPTGKVDPDPEVLPGARDSLNNWSSSLEVMMRRVPETRLLVAIVSGVLAPSCLRNPLTHLPKEDWQKQKLAEFLQVIQQLLFRSKFDLLPKLTFGEPQTASDLLMFDGQKNLHEAIIHWADQVLNEHLRTVLDQT